MIRNLRAVTVIPLVVFVVSGLLALGAAPAHAATDTTAPNLVEFSFTPDTIDTGAAARTITVTARITDDVSGLASSGTSVTFSPPSGYGSVQATFDSTKRISGTPQDGTYRASLVVPRYSVQGTWKLSSAYLYDSSGHSRYLSAADFTAAGFPTSFVQTAVGDSAPPVIAEFDLSPASVDTSAAARTVTMTARIKDDVSGFGNSTGCCSPGYGYVQFSTPGGSTTQVSFNASQRISGTALDGVFRSTIELPRYSQQGTWRITSASLSDLAGNSKSLAAADFVDAGFPTSFAQTAVGDSDPPVLASLTATPASVDTAAAARTVTVTAQITDDVSGLGSYSYVTFTAPSGGRTMQVPLDSSKRISGTAQNGTYRATFDLPRYSAQGVWRVTSGSLTDAANHYRSLSPSDLSDPAVAASFNQTAVGDATPPALASLQFTPTTVDASAAARTITVTARITDDVSGFAGGSNCCSPSVRFSSPGGTRSLDVYFDSSKRISGTAQDGIYQSAVVVPRYAEQGTWRITSGYLVDAANNSKNLSVADFVDAGLPTTFQQTGVGDLAPPVLTDLSFTPVSLDTSAAAQTVTVTAHITDDVSGLTDTNAYGYLGSPNPISFRSPSGNRTLTAAFDSSVRISGTATDGVYRLSLVVPRYAEKGTWRLNSVNFSDVAGNSRSLSATDVANAGFATAFEQTAVGDSTPPVIAALSFSPAAVDTSTSAQNVTISAHITDDLVGLGPTMPSFYFTSPSLAQGTNTTAEDTRLVSGNAKDGTFEFTVTVPRFAEVGTWYLSNVFLSDALGNSRTLTAPDLIAAGFPTTFVVTTLPPGTPNGVSAAPGNGSATVTWTEPPANGASAVTAYTVSAYVGTTAVQTKTVAAPATSTTAAGLTNGTAYTFTVTATNGSGTGSPSSPSGAVSPRTVPSAPTGVVASAGIAAATVSWSAPAANGGSAITSFTVTTYAGTAAVQTMTVTAPATSATVTGLANSSTYTFTVAATNAAGTGASATSNAVVPRGATINATPIDVNPSPPSVPTPDPQVISVGTGSGYWMVGSDGKVYAFGDAPQLGAPAGALGSSAAVDLEPSSSGHGYWVLDDRGRVYAYGDAPALGNVDPARLVAGEEAISFSSTKSGQGYWIFTTKGRVLSFGDAVFYGDMSAVRLNGPVLDSIPTASGKGYYMVASDGGIFSFGDAKFYGSMGGQHLNAPIQSLVPDGDGVGYWLVASDGGIFAFAAPFKGSLGNLKLNQPITGMVRYGEGYLMVAEDGGVFDFSGSPNGFKGSLGGTPPSRPIGSVAAFGG